MSREEVEAEVDKILAFVDFDRNGMIEYSGSYCSSIKSLTPSKICFSHQNLLLWPWIRKFCYLAIVCGQHLTCLT